MSTTSARASSGSGAPRRRRTASRSAGGFVHGDAHAALSLLLAQRGEHDGAAAQAHLGAVADKGAEILRRTGNQRVSGAREVGDALEVVHHIDGHGTGVLSRPRGFGPPPATRSRECADEAAARTDAPARLGTRHC